jgi:enterochelin esterase family protein
MKTIACCVLLIFSMNLKAQDYSLIKKEWTRLADISKVSDSTDRNTQLQKWWSELKDRKLIPLVAEDSVLFFFRGKANPVEWTGDFNGWGYDKSFPNKGTHLANTDVWFLKSSFPKDARLDYKIILNGKDYILDPDNPYQQWSGVGGGSPNSELRMPEWKDDPETFSKPNLPHGEVSQDILFHSKILGYQITYNVYLPNNYASLGALPVIYVTDGYEYLHPKMGNMATVLDNLIGEKKIKPVVAVFVDHREPINRSNNKRMMELAMNNTYLDFFVKELIPQIEKNYKVISAANQRAILGTSMGGLTATYFAFARPDVFGMAGIQSPAFWTKPQIYQLCSNPSNPSMKISMTAGLINDTSKESRKMKDILATTSCEYHYREVNEGHSWGNWRNLIGNILTDFFAIK